MNNNEYNASEGSLPDAVPPTRAPLRVANPSEE